MSAPILPDARGEAGPLESNGPDVALEVLVGLERHVAAGGCVVLCSWWAVRSGRLEASDWRGRRGDWSISKIARVSKKIPRMKICTVLLYTTCT